MAVGIFALASCNKSDDQSLKQSNASNSNIVYVADLRLANPLENLIEISSEDFLKNYSSNAVPSLKKGKSSHAHGNFTWGPTANFTFSGTQNKGGSHGTATLTFPAPDPTQTVVIYLDTECVTIQDSAATYSGSITQVDNYVLPPNVGPFALGNIVSFNVIDNGEGVNASPDQYSLVFYFSPPALGCSAPSNFAFFPIANVLPGEKIKINDN